VSLPYNVTIFLLLRELKNAHKLQKSKHYKGIIRIPKLHTTYQEGVWFNLMVYSLLSILVFLSLCPTSVGFEMTVEVQFLGHLMCFALPVSHLLWLSEGLTPDVLLLYVD